MGRNVTITARVQRGVAVLAIAAIAATVAGGSAASAKVSAAKAVPLTTAATWLAIGPDLKLQAGQAGQATTTAAADMQIEALVKGLALQGAAYQTFARTAADPADASRLVGNYITKVFVFKNAADAKKFRDADVKEVLGHKLLEKAGTYKDGTVLYSDQGLVNVMYTIGNVAVDVRTGVTETGPGSGVTDAKNVADAVAAKAKASS